MVPASGVRPPLSNLALSTGRHVCNQTQLQTDQVYVPRPGPKRLGGGRSNSLLGGPAGQGDLQAVRSPVQEGDPDSSRLAQHAVVLGSSGSVVPDTHLSPQPSRSGDPAIHRDLTSLNLHTWLLEPRQSRSRGSLTQWWYELRLLKDAQPEQSMMQSGPFLKDGVKQVRWTSGRHLSNK